MAIEKLPEFRNINWDYKDQHDTFVGRGLHLNMLNDQLSMVIDNVNNLVENPQSYTFENGLTETDGVVRIGSPLSGASTIHFDDWCYLNMPAPYQYIFTVSSATGSGGSHTRVTQEYSLWSIQCGDEPKDDTSTIYHRISAGTSATDVGLMRNTGSWLYSRFYLTTTSMLVQDNINTKGLIYESDYSAAGVLDDRWIPDYGAVKAYADSVGGGSYTFSSGLTESGGTVTLGGTLTQGASITTNPGNPFRIYELEVGYSSLVSSEAGEFKVNSVNGASLNLNLGSSLLYLKASTATFGYHTTSINYKMIEITNTTMTVTDAKELKGLVYAADYDTNGVLDDNWIPSYRAVKAYADSVGGGTPVSFGTAQYQIPYTNTTTNDFDYNADFVYAAGLLRVGPSDNNASLTSSTIYVIKGDSFGYSTYDSQNWGDVAGISNLIKFTKTGGTYSAPTAAPTDATIVRTTYQVWDGTNTRTAGSFYVNVDGAVATDNFNTEMEWFLKIGASASALRMRLSSTGLRLGGYGSGTITGTPTYNLAVDATGNIIETSISGGGTVTEVTSSTTNQLTVANGTTTPALTVVTGAVTNGGTALATGDQIYDFVIGLGYSTTVGTVTSVSGTGTVDGITLSGTVTSSGSLTLGGNISVSSATGVLPVSHGGTGLSTIGVNYILTGNGTSAMTAEANLTFSGSTLAVTGAITATGEITAYSSDERLKTNIKRITNPVGKVKRLYGVTYEWRQDVCNRVGFVPAHEVETGMIAQNLGSVIKDAVSFAPFDRDYHGNSISGEDYLTVKLDKSIPLIIEALKEVIGRLEKLENN
jgi:hypothetical protein